MLKIPILLPNSKLPTPNFVPLKKSLDQKQSNRLKFGRIVSFAPPATTPLLLHRTQNSFSTSELVENIAMTAVEKEKVLSL